MNHHTFPARPKCCIKLFLCIVRQQGLACKIKLIQACKLESALAISFKIPSVAEDSAHSDPMRLGWCVQHREKRDAVAVIHSRHTPGHRKIRRSRGGVGCEVSRTVLPWRALNATLGVFCSEWRGDESLWRVAPGSPCFRRIPLSAAHRRFAQGWAQRVNYLKRENTILSSLPRQRAEPYAQLMSQLTTFTLTLMSLPECGSPSPVAILPKVRRPLGTCPTQPLDCRLPEGRDQGESPSVFQYQPILNPQQVPTDVCWTNAL